MFDQISQDRRRLLGAAALTLGAAGLGLIGSVRAQAGKPRPADLPAIKPGTSTSFGSPKQIDVGLLSVRYAEAGPADGRAVILLHGWPYDINSTAPAQGAGDGVPAAGGREHHRTGQLRRR